MPLDWEQVVFSKIFKQRIDTKMIKSTSILIKNYFKLKSTAFMIKKSQHMPAVGCQGEGGSQIPPHFWLPNFSKISPFGIIL